MAEDRTRRFARLERTGRPDQSPRSSGQSLDLFEHFGVVEPAEEPAAALSPPVAALPCPDCGWLRATPLVEPCPTCACPPRRAEGPTEP